MYITCVPYIFQLYIKGGVSAITFVSAGLSGICFGVFAIITPVVLHFLVKRHVLQMYFNNETKVCCITVSNT